MHTNVKTIPSFPRDAGDETEGRRLVKIPAPSRALFPGWGPKLLLSVAVFALTAGSCKTADAMTMLRGEHACNGTKTEATVDAPPAEWPEIAKSMNAQGNVVVRLDLSDSGTLLKETLISTSGIASLDAEALRVARVAQYRPAVDNCRPVASSYTFRVSFES